MRLRILRRRPSAHRVARRRAAAAGDRRHDRDLVRFLDLGVEVLEEADVLVVGEDVDELADRAAVVADPRLDARVGLLEAFDHLAHGLARGGHLFLAFGQLAERSRDADGCHDRDSFSVTRPRWPARTALTAWVR